MGLVWGERLTHVIDEKMKRTYVYLGIWTMSRMWDGRRGMMKEKTYLYMVAIGSYLPLRCVLAPNAASVGK